MAIRVLIVDDSPFVCRLLTSFLRSSGDIEVVGNALCGERAVELVDQLRPDVVTLDLEMPGIGGLEALDQIITNRPTPVVLMSGLSRKAAETAVSALELGAVDFILKYTPGHDTDPDALRQQLLNKVRLAAGVKVIRSLRSQNLQPAREQRKPLVDLTATPPPGLSQSNGLLVIGASTGGPIAIRDLLSGLSSEFPTPMLIVQHMPGTFTKALAEQLDRHTPIVVQEAVPGDKLRPGVALVAPGERHLVLRNDGRIELNEAAKVGGHRPSIDVTMESAVKAFGARTQGVLLTGMGEDGARGLKAIRDAGGQTYAQSADTCVVFGMPARAIEMGAADVVDSPIGIAKRLTEAAFKPRGAFAW